MKPYSLINELDCSADLNKNMTLKYDAGNVKSKKSGEATLSGDFLLMNRHGQFPKVYLKDIKERANSWWNEMGLEELHDEVFEKMNLPAMTTYLAAGVDPEKLELVFQTLVFMFIYDDAVVKLTHLNNNNPIKHREDIKRVAESLLSIITNYGDSESTVAAVFKLNPSFKPICMALKYVCSYSFREMHKDDYVRFGRELMDFIRANKWEQEYLNSPYYKNDFLFLRHENAGVSPAMYSVYFVKNIRLSKDIRTHPLFQRYLRNAVMHVALSNDVLSLKKEIADNDVEQNFVLLKCRKYTLQESIYKVEKTVNRLMITLKKDGIKLKSYFPTDDSLKNFVHTTEYMIDGFLYWYQQSRRYGSIKFEKYVVKYDCDYNSWLEEIGINDVENMKEPELRIESMGGYPSVFT